MELDSELVIKEVEKFPVLYDPGDEQYKNRIDKLEAWKKVAETVIGESYSRLDKKQQHRIRIEVQKKWKAIKDAYIRSLKLQAQKKGGVNSKRRPYFYHHQMSFLHLSIQNLPTGNKRCAHEAEEVRNKANTAVRPYPVFQQRKEKQKKENFESQLLKILKDYIGSGINETTSSPTENDCDKLFLLSILPKMKLLNQSASFDFQIKVMQLLQNYLSDTSNLSHSVPSTSNTVPSLVSQSQPKISQLTQNNPHDHPISPLVYSPLSSNSPSPSLQGPEYKYENALSEELVDS